MDTPTPDANSVVPTPKRVIKMVPKYILDQITVESSIVGLKKASEGLLLAFENLAEEGNALRLSQQTEIMGTVMFCLRDLETELEASAGFGVAVHNSIYGETTLPVAATSVEEFEEMFEFDPTDSDDEEK
jgi:hypothetical protein